MDRREMVEYLQMSSRYPYDDWPDKWNGLFELYMAKMDIIIVLKRICFIHLHFDDLCREILVTESCPDFITSKLTCSHQFLTNTHEVHDGQMNGDSLFQFRNPKNKSHQLFCTITKLTQIQIPLVSAIRVVGANGAMSCFCWLHVIS